MSLVVPGFTGPGHVFQTISRWMNGCAKEHGLLYPLTSPFWGGETAQLSNILITIATILASAFVVGSARNTVPSSPRTLAFPLRVHVELPAVFIRSNNCACTGD
jgi:hypothetical protein